MYGYSHSQIQTHLTCPLKWKFDKLDGLGKTSKESSLNLILGTAVHAALEFLYKQRSQLKTPLQLQVEQIYLMTFAKECNESTTEFLDEDKADFIARGKHYLNWYWEKYFPFDQTITMAVEEGLSYIMNDNIRFTGYIDRLDVRGDELIIIDYKTSKKLEADDADSHKQQITLYAAGLAKKYGSKFTRYTGKIIYLHLEKEVSRDISPQEQSEISAWYLQEAQNIENKKNLQLRSPQRNNIFLPQVGSHCNYCPFKMICPQRKHEFMADEIIGSESLSEKTIKQLIDDYAVLQKKIGILSKEKDTIATLLVDYAQQHNLPVLYGNEWKTSVQKRSYFSIKTEFEELFINYCKQYNLLDQLMKIDATALAKAIQEKLVTQETKERIQQKDSARLGVVSKKKE